ncbi:MAG TPA: TonB C-terminal domain-containing protein [Candidatus Udaeobacter sp.]|jgi:TonB family protein|nr:TonB C-terminal domain-containing protein [Candidatus Udaeobacter sp.]
MAKEPSSPRYGTPSGRFWTNVVLIGLAHIALIAGLIRWSVAARASSNPESIVWLGGAGNLPAEESEKRESPLAKQRLTETEPSKSEKDEAAVEKPVVTTAKSEIELPTTTPKPTPTATPPPKPSVTPALRTKSIPKPTPRKTLVAKASPKPAKPKSNPAKANARSEKKDKITLAKNDSAPQSGSGQSAPTNKNGSAGGEDSASEFGWYGNMLHDRFYSAWIQPTTNVPSGEKISTLASVRIEKDGRVSRFEIAKPSKNATVNESVAAVAKQVSQVDPPPTGLIKGDHYDVKINFELNTEEGGSNR